MKYAQTLILCAIVATVALICWELVRWLFHRPKGGFREWLRNPDYQRAAEKRIAARKALTIPADLSDEALAEMVERLFVEKDDDFNFERLQLVGQRGVPLLIAALDEPRTATVDWGFSGAHGLAGDSPLERICNLLEPFAPHEAIGPLARFAQSPKESFRKAAARALGNIAATDCSAPLRKLLDDEDDYVRGNAMTGIEGAIEAKRGDPLFLEAIFPAVVKLLNRSDMGVGGEPPKLLLKIDVEKALPILLSPEYLTTSNGELYHLLDALNEGGFKVPQAQLGPLLSELKKKSIQPDSLGRDYAAALRVYARNPDEATEQTLRTELTSPNDRIARAACEALAYLSGIENPLDAIQERMNESGFAGLTEPQQNYEAVFLYDAEVRNGGHLQYFANSSGNNWKSARRGLTAVGAAERARMLEEAIAVFGPGGPPEDREARQAIVARFSKSNDAAMEALDDRYYAGTENLEKLLSLYAIENKKHFVLSRD